MRRVAAIVVSAALASTAAAAEPRDAEFEGPQEPPHLAVGPVPVGDTMVCADLGWLRSGLRADIGVGDEVSLFVRADAFLLHDGLQGQDRFMGGVRYSLLVEGGLRASVEGSAGVVLVPQAFGQLQQLVVGGELVVAAWLDEWGLPYARAAYRALHYDIPTHSGWAGDGELGIGYEHPVGRFTVGAEGFLWLRPGLPRLDQWRIRVGIVL